MTKVLSVVVVLAAAAGAQASFSLVAVDFAAGSPLVASADYVQAASAAGDDRGMPAALAAIGTNLSSSLWISGTGITVGPSMPDIPGLESYAGRPADLVAPSNTDGIIGNTLGGSWLIADAAGEPFGDNAASGFPESVLVARLSVPTGATIDFGSASALVTAVFDGDTGPHQQLVTFGGSQTLSFEAVLHQSGGLLEGTAVDTFDIYVVVIPAPSAVALAGIAGLAGVRRRR